MRRPNVDRPGRRPLIALALVAGCHPNRLNDEELRDPKQCQTCHPDHYDQWAGSMHAYASDDPVFRAMNALGQRETGGDLGDFCVKCHAPAALLLGETKDGTDLNGVDDTLRGVTCWYCHQVTGVDGDHNNPLELAQDRVFRGPIRDPVENKAHESEGSALHDRDDTRSSDLCGSCHDIVTPLGVHLEATYAEWQVSLFARPGFGLTCSGCHMTGTDGVAAEAEGVPLRRVHDHGFPGVDKAIGPFPDKERQAALVQDLLEDTVNAYLCVGPPGDPTLATVTLENVAAGHKFPSGATSDRRVWVEITAYQGDQVLYQSGAVDPRIGASTDPDLFRMWSTLAGEGGEPVHQFWEATDIASDTLLPVQITLDPTDPQWVQTHVTKSWLVTGGVPDRVTMAVHVQPIGGEILDVLVDAGELDRADADAITPITLAPTVLEWTPAVPVNAGSLACVPDPVPVTAQATTTP